MRRTFFIIMLFSILNTLASAEPLEIGAQAPAVQSVDDKGDSIDFGAALNDGTVLVFFYPKAMTPGCTKQACSLRDGWTELQERGVTVYGVSSDSAEAQAQFRAKHNLQFTLIADQDKAVADAFGKGRWSRQAYLFQDGTLVWRDLNASTSDQFEDVIEALEQI